MLEKIKKIIYKLWPFFFIFIIWLIFASPYFLSGKIPFSTTYLTNFFAPWSAYSIYEGPVKNNAMPDVISQIYPWKTFAIEMLKNFQIPFWNPYSFSGTVHLANYQSAVFSPFNIMFLILPIIDAWSILVLLQPLLAGLFMYLYLQTIQKRKEAGVLGAVSFMFCGFIITWMGYATLGYAILFLPLALYLIEKFYGTHKLKYLFLFSATFPLSFFSGHFQISLYFLIFVVFYLIFKFWEEKDKKAAFYTFLYLFLGLFLTAPQVIPSIEAYLQSFRSGLFEKTEVIPWGYIATFFAPDIYGNPVTRNDWFGHYAEWNAYIGLLPLALSIYALTFNRNNKIFFFAFASIFSLLLSFGSPLIELIIYLKIPVLSTSAAGRIIVLFSFSMVVLSVFGLNNLFEDLRKNKIKNALIWLFVISSIFIFLWLTVFLKVFISSDKIFVARQNLILPTALFLGILIIISSGIILARIKKLNKYLFLIPYVFILLVSLDMLRFAFKWQPFDPKELFYPKIPIEDGFKKISGFDRTFGNLGGEATIYYKLQSIEGYDAVYNKRYGEFIASLKNGNLSPSFRSVVSFPKYGLFSQTGLNLLGVKYLIHKIADGRAVWAYPFWNSPESFNLLYDDGVYQIYENRKAFPRAFLVNHIKVQSDPQEILNAMFLDDENLRENVVLEENPNIVLNMVKGNAQIRKYQPNYVKIEANSDGNALLFLSDAYYPGWRAYINGRETKIFRADFTFKAVTVPKGKNTIEFKFEPSSFKLGVFVAFAGFLGMFGVYFLRSKVILSPKI